MERSGPKILVLALKDPQQTGLLQNEEITSTFRKMAQTMKKILAVLNHIAFIQYYEIVKW